MSFIILSKKIRSKSDKLIIILFRRELQINVTVSDSLISKINNNNSFFVSNIFLVK